MAESYSVKARFSAVDNGFTSTLKSAIKSTETLGSKIKSGFNFGFLAGAGSKAFGALVGGAKSLVSEINSSNVAWQTFDGNMAILGKSASEVAKVKKDLQKFAEDTIYSSSDMAATYAQLASVGVDSAEELVKGFGGLAASAENPQQAMKTLSQQATQMAARPKVAWQDFKLMLEQSPAGMAAVARQMGMTTSELVSNIQAGEVSTNDFFKAIKQVAGTGTDFAKLAQKPKSVGQAFDSLKETLANKLSPAFQKVSEAGINALGGISDAIGKINVDKIVSGIESAVDFIKNLSSIAKTAFSGVGDAFKSAFQAIGDALSDTNSEFSKTDVLNAFKSACEAVAGALKSVAGFMKEHADEIAKALPVIAKVAGAFLAWKAIKKVVPGVSLLTSGLKSLGGKAISGIAGKLFKTKEASDAVGKSAGASGKSMLTAAKSYALMGVAVFLIAAGFALLAYSAISLANAGGGAIAVMAGLVIALAALGFGMGALMKTMTTTPKKMQAASLAFLAMGAAVLLVAIGFGILAYSAIALAAAGWPAIAVMIGLVAVIALLAVGAAALGAALTAGALGFITFGAAIVLCGVGALLAAAALQMITGILPALIEYGLSGAVSILALGAALLVFGVGALVAGAGALVLGAGLLVCAAAVLLLAAGVLVLGLGMVMVGTGAMGSAGAFIISCCITYFSRKCA